MKQMLKLASLAASALLFTACIATYDQTAHQNALTGKVSTLAVMDKATAPYATHAGEVTSLRTQLDGYLQYERSRANNQASIQMWDVMLRADSSLNRFFQRWQSAPPSRAYIANKKKHLASAFDILTELELAKPRK